MKATSLVIACSVSFACALGSCSSSPSGVPAVPSFDPFGTEPVPTTGSEPTGGESGGPPGPGSSIEELCAYDCTRFEAGCPGAAGGANCASDCASSVTSFPNCKAQLQAYLACVTTAPFSCVAGSVEIPACDNAASVVTDCANQGGTTTGSGGSK